ncbi:MAG: type II secretion system F family protein [Chloroflexi bacterium]|nr:type II secretion system F family protein [Chloroflexota bacterium]
MTTLLSFLGAAGILLLYLALTHSFTATVSLAGGRAQTYTVPLIDRAFGPFLASASRLLSRILRYEADDEKRLLAAGRPARYPTVESFYAWKVFNAVLFFLLGLAGALVAGTGLLPLALIAGVVGLYLPDLHLNQLIKRRRELVKTEMAFTLLRIAMHLQAGRAFHQAIDAVAARPGALFVEELRVLRDQLNTGQPLPDALQVVIERNPGMGEIERFADTTLRAQRLGQPLALTLIGMGETMQDQVQQDIEARGLAASVLMVLPIGGLILPAIGIVVMGPAIFLAAQYFFR